MADSIMTSSIFLKDKNKQCVEFRIEVLPNAIKISRNGAPLEELQQYIEGCIKRKFPGERFGGINNELMEIIKSECAIKLCSPEHGFGFCSNEKPLKRRVGDTLIKVYCDNECNAKNVEIITPPPNLSGKIELDIMNGKAPILFNQPNEFIIQINAKKILDEVEKKLK